MNINSYTDIEQSKLLVNDELILTDDEKFKLYVLSEAQEVQRLAALNSLHSDLSCSLLGIHLFFHDHIDKDDIKTTYFSCLFSSKEDCGQFIYDAAKFVLDWKAEKDHTNDE